MKKYAFFDFDGTLIAKDSFRIILKNTLLKQPWRLFFIALFSPIYLWTLIFKIDKAYAKSAILWSLTFGKSKTNTIRYFKSVLAPHYEEIWFTQAQAEFEQLKAQGVEIIVVTASGQCWVRALLREKGRGFRAVIGSQLRFFAGGVIFSSKNCYGAEKILRIEQLLGKDIEWHSAWSDHPADLPMLLKSNEKKIIAPLKKHLKVFAKNIQTPYEIKKWKVVKK
ncbi:MAG: haloacid dehalogenase-like hydrolase [Silvanigrellaceae bacterium]|nr:haloacid dehalogenase-like hydrolase [Silvanigrellaceae bacterium]